MGQTIRKEVIRPGTYTYIDEDTGLPRKLVVTPQTVRYWHDEGQKMLAGKLSIPVPLEHQKEAKPLTEAERKADLLKNNAGWVNGYEIGEVEEDGQKVKDVLFANVDITDPSIKGKLPHTIRWTSPWINSFTDGDGASWNGVISHLALTTRPRITRQQPFPTVAAALSLVSQLRDEDPAKKSKGLGLSRAGLLKSEGEKLLPAYPMAFSLYTGIRLAEDDMPPEMMKDKGKSKPEPKPDKDEPPPMDDDPMALLQQEEALVDADGDISIYDVICDLLETQGYTLPDGTDETNFLEHMYQACMDKLKSSKGPDMPETPNPPDAGKTPPPVVEQTPPLPMYMSMEQIQKIKDPDAKQIALSLHQSQEELRVLRENALNEGRVQHQARLERIAANLPQNARDDLVALDKGAQFSIGKDGKVVDSMDQILTTMEKMLSAMPELLTTKGAAFAQPHPKEPPPEGQVSKEQAKEAADLISGKLGLPKVA